MEVLFDYHQRIEVTSLQSRMSHRETWIESNGWELAAIVASIGGERSNAWHTTTTLDASPHTCNKI